MGLWLRLKEWVADHFGTQYPRQTFIPARPAPSSQLLPEQRLLLGVMGGLVALVALFLLGIAAFVVYLLLKTYAFTS